MNELSIRYLEGRGVERNYEMAEALFNNIISLDESLSEKEKLPIIYLINWQSVMKNSPKMIMRH